MLRITLPNGCDTIAPAFFTSLTSPLRKPIARGSSSTSRVSMHVRITSFLFGNGSVRKASYSLRSMNDRLCSSISETMVIVRMILVDGPTDERAGGGGFVLRIRHRFPTQASGSCAWAEGTCHAGFQHA